jgi:hypothetical protein
MRFFNSALGKSHYIAAMSLLVLMMLALHLAIAAPATSSAPADNLVHNGDFTLPAASGKTVPADFQISGDVVYRNLADATHTGGWGVAFKSQADGTIDRTHAPAGSVSQTVSGLDQSLGKTFRFRFRGLPQDGFAVTDDDLSMKVEFFANGGQTSYDGKSKKLYPQVERDRKDMTVNGDNHVAGAVVWRTYDLEFRLPFPQVDQVRLSIEFGHGAGRGAASQFYVTDVSLTRIDDAALPVDVSAAPTTKPSGNLIPLGGRWFYAALPGQTKAPTHFDYTNVERLLYHDSTWSAPFDGEVSTFLRAGDLDVNGNLAKTDRAVPDNVTIDFDATTMTIHSKGLPNHPTGVFPGRGDGGNPNYIQEKRETFYLPINPRVNPNHIATTTDNSNHALHMGPIGVAVNGVVFFNPFDADSQDASSIMDYCCGHPNQDNLYHYHKYPICINSPWADEGKAHSPLIGFAFDGFPIYGPYANENVMAKDVKGDYALNDFNMHQDAERGWHYQVTPGKFPYVIGGFWGAEDPRNQQTPGGGRGMRGQGRPGGPGNGPGGGPGNGGPGPGPGGFRGPPPFGPPGGPPPQ